MQQQQEGGTQQEPACWRMVSKDGLLQHRLPLGMSFIGRQECDILLQSSSVDKRHAVIFYEGGEVRVKDLNSLTGTYVNNVRISGQTYVPLKNMDTLRFGFGPDIFFVQKVPSPSCSPKKLSPAKESPVQPLPSAPPPSPEQQPVVLPPSSSHHQPVEAGDVHSDSKSSLHDSLEDVTPVITKSRPLAQVSPLMEVDSSAPVVVPSGGGTDGERLLSCCPQDLPTPPVPTATKAADSSPVSMAFTIAFDTENVAVPKKKLGIKDSISKFAPRKADVPDRSGSTSSSSTTPTAAISKLKHSKSTDTPVVIPPASSKKGTPRSHSSRPSESHQRKGSSSGRSNSSTEDCSKSPHGSSCSARVSSGSTGSKLSDSASYLIQRMLNGDPPGKPRQQPSPEDHPDDKSETGTYTVEPDPQVCEARDKIDEVFGLADKPPNGQGPHVPLSKGPPLPKQDVVSPSSEEAVPLRPKRRLPTPPANQVPHTGGRLNLEFVSRGDWRWSPEQFASPTETQSEGSPQARPPLWHRKTSWNLSTEAEATKSETASVGSDRSTDSTHSSRDPAGPQMRLNRAFALRRARLGIDSDPPPAPRAKSPKPKPKCPPSPNLSRQDGGRFSLRLGKNTKPPSILAEQKQLRNQNVQALQASSHRRIESDPGKAWRQQQQAAAVSDSDRSRQPPPDNGSFHRSASFNGTDRLLHGSPKTERKRISHLSTVSSRAKEVCRPPRYTAPPQPPPPLCPVMIASPESQPSDFLKETLSTKRELSALDSLVISAIYQLSYKLRSEARTLLEKESQHQPENSDSRLMIEEVLPQISDKSREEAPQTDGSNVTRDLSTILKNLKRVQQTLEVMSSLMETEVHETRRPAESKLSAAPRGNNFFVVDV